MEDEKPLITEGRKLRHPPRPEHFKSEDSKELHRKRLSEAMKDIWARRRAGEVVTRKPVKYEPHEKPPYNCFGRCIACRQLFATKDDLAIHERFCFDYQQYMKGIRSCTQMTMKQKRGE
jgi:hypothetical protein